MQAFSQDYESGRPISEAVMPLFLDWMPHMGGGGGFNITHMY